MRQGGNVAAGRHAKTPKGQVRQTVHAARDHPPYEVIFPSIFRRRLKISEITTHNGGGHAQSRILLVPRIMLLSFDGLRGYAPQINRDSGGSLFARRGGKIYSAPPACFDSPGRMLTGGFGDNKLAIFPKLNLSASEHVPLTIHSELNGTLKGRWLSFWRPLSYSVDAGYFTDYPGFHYVDSYQEGLYQQ